LVQSDLLEVYMSLPPVSPAAAPTRVIVSGGTGALGQSVVAALVAAGARVAVPWREASGFARLAASVGSNAALWGAEADLGDTEAAQRFTAAAVDWLGGLDGLACIAGAYAGAGPLETAPADEWSGMLSANLQSAYSLCRAALPQLLIGGGSIVLVGSRLVRTGGAGAAGYAVSKAAVEALSLALAAENRTRGVRVNCIEPGTIDTAANRAAMPSADRSEWTPPEQIARLVLFLLGPQSAPLTGAVLPIDGRASA
jgi:NAD(P)-dependent dehydrogenase (short-subunit alcohol dehydrogenase family)